MAAVTRPGSVSGYGTFLIIKTVDHRQEFGSRRYSKLEISSAYEEAQESE